MRLLVVGVNHHTARLAVRERAALSPALLAEALHTLKTRADEAVLLSTCNRTELYAVASEAEAPSSLFAAAFPEEAPGLEPYFFHRVERDVVTHLLRVASGIDSVLLGETEILGQIRRSWESAHVAGSTGPVTSRLFNTAVAVGKRARSETDIGRFPASVASAAAVLLRQAVGDLSGCTVLIVGTGEVGEGVARCLAENRAARLLVANHRSEGALALAMRYQATPVGWPLESATLAEADVVITCTGAPGIVIGADDVAQAQALRGERPLHFIDLAVPRDVEPSVGALAGVSLHNIDDVSAVVEESRMKRERMVPQVEAIVEEAANGFGAWLRERTVFPTIKILRQQAERRVDAETRWALAKLAHLSMRDRHVVEALASRLTNKLVHGPTVGLRRAARAGQGEEYRLMVEDLYGLREVE